jgi:hypothetical protein
MDDEQAQARIALLTALRDSALALVKVQAEILARLKGPPLGELNPPMVARMLDEIRRNCTHLLSDDFELHSAAFLWLRACKPFRRVVDELRHYDMNVYDAAAALAEGSTRPTASVTLMLLEREILAEQGGSP